MKVTNKVGIITFHRAINYGAVLQTYGLWASLRNIGVNADVIDYRNEHIEKLYDVTWGLKKTRDGIKAWLPTVPLKQSKNKHFREFLSKETTLSKPCTKANISDVARDYGTVITGSDQVFNPKLSARDKAFFCDFVKDDAHRFSYAASLGDYQFDETEDEDFIELLNRFDAISVREPAAVEHISQFTDAPVCANVDPTLLLDYSEWNALLPEERIWEKPYIFLYSVHPFKSGLQQARELAESTGQDIVYLHNRIRDTKTVRGGVYCLHDSSPYDWLRLIRDADTVITNSFHGTAFSVIFRKRFLSEIDTRGGFNNRIWSLLSSTGLLGNVLERYNIISNSIVDDVERNVSWNRAEEYFALQRRQAIEYLSKICDMN